MKEYALNRQRRGKWKAHSRQKQQQVQRHGNIKAEVVLKIRILLCSLGLRNMTVSGRKRLRDVERKARFRKILHTRLNSWTFFCRWEQHTFNIIQFWDFLGGPAAKPPHSQCRRPRVDPWSGN